MMIATAAGWILQLTGSYHSLFVLVGCAYLLALLVIHLIVPRLEPARIGEGAGA
jgi:ACS family hexuronate transporter-like MFS transporter